MRTGGTVTVGTLPVGSDTGIVGRVMGWAGLLDESPTGLGSGVERGLGPSEISIGLEGLFRMIGRVTAGRLTGVTLEVVLVKFLKLKV